MIRKIKKREIQQLEKQGCIATDWDLITVTDNVALDNIIGSTFIGDNYIGVTDGLIDIGDGVVMPSGLYNTTFKECRIFGKLFIRNVKRYIANYDIETDVIIDNCDTIAVTGSTQFGNGIAVKAINEEGMRAVSIYDFLSSNLAYLSVFYQHKTEFIDKLSFMIESYCSKIRSTRGVIGAGSKVISCGKIENVKIGKGANIYGAMSLINGSINSVNRAVVTIGAGVIMKGFIVNSGSTIIESTIVENCFIGQGVVLEKNFSATESLLFANCHGAHGEACSIFGGPYTVSHHKSSLLIAGLFSFVNAGSGSNQSNHMYKLGAIHQGVIERGGKTTSDSYILWPSKIGAFSMIMGRHYKNCDTSNFPFSYMIGKNGDTFMFPGINLKSIGTIRDSKKWPARDKRTDSNLTDNINFNLLSPYTVAKMMAGIKILDQLKSTSGDSDLYSYQNMNISKKSLCRGKDLYDKAIYKFMGNSLIKRLENLYKFTDVTIQKALEPDTPIGRGKWVDLAGMLAPETVIDQFLNTIDQDSVESIEECESYMADIHNRYFSYEWTWCCSLIEEYYGKSVDNLTCLDVQTIVERWKDAVLSIDRYLLEDASKEFSRGAMVSFGIDGEDKEKEDDFETVRGKFEKHPLVMDIYSHMKVKGELGDSILEKIGDNVNKI